MSADILEASGYFTLWEGSGRREAETKGRSGGILQGTTHAHPKHAHRATLQAMLRIYEEAFSLRSQLKEYGHAKRYIEKRYLNQFS